MTQDERRSILVETVREFAQKQWFRDAAVYDMHPITGEPTLEFKVNFIPLFERKLVKDFCLKVNLHERFVVVDKAGNPAE